MKMAKLFLSLSGTAKIFIFMLTVFITTYVIINLASFKYIYSYFVTKREHSESLCDDNGSRMDQTSPHASKGLNDDEDKFTTISTLLNLQLDEDLDNYIERKTVRLLCWIMTDPDILHKAVPAKETWMKRCDIQLFMSSKENKDFPTVGLDVPAGRPFLAIKSKAAWTYVYNNYRDQADFFLKADPDSYIVVDNLKQYLANCNSTEPSIFGHNLFLGTTSYGGHYVAGEAVVLTRESLIRLVTKGMTLDDCYPEGEAEDAKTSHCLLEVGGYVVDTRDLNGRETFLPPFKIAHINGNLPDWYTKLYRPYGFCQSLDCLSEYPIVFHYVEEYDFYLMEYLFRIHRNAPRLLYIANGRKPGGRRGQESYKQFTFNGTKYTKFS